MPIICDLSQWNAWASTFDFRCKSYEEKVKLAIDSAASELAMEILPEINDMHTRAVDAWYAAYSPSKYQRRGFVRLVYTVEDRSSPNELNIVAVYDEAIPNDKGVPNLYQYQWIEGAHGPVSTSESPEQAVDRMAGEETPRYTQMLSEKIRQRVAAISF